MSRWSILPWLWHAWIEKWRAIIHLIFHIKIWVYEWQHISDFFPPFFMYNNTWLRSFGHGWTWATHFRVNSIISQMRSVLHVFQTRVKIPNSSPSNNLFSSRLVCYVFLFNIRYDRLLNREVDEMVKWFMYSHFLNYTMFGSHCSKRSVEIFVTCLQAIESIADPTKKIHYETHWQYSIKEQYEFKWFKTY